METTTIEQKLLDFQKKVSVIKKDAKNPHFKNTYASLTQILSEVKPILSECGLILLQPIKDGNVCTLIVDSDLPASKQLGNAYDAMIPLPAGLNPQQLGSAITYFRRYTLASLLALEIDDDDAQEASKPVELPWLNENTESWYKVTEALQGGGYTIAQVEKKYRISEANKAKLLKVLELGV